MALASSALTALVPLSILLGAVLGNFVHYDAAERIIKRYDLTGAGATAVNSSSLLPKAPVRAWASSGSCF